MSTDAVISALGAAVCPLKGCTRREHFSWCNLKLHLRDYHEIRIDSDESLESVAQFLHSNATCDVGDRGDNRTGLPPERVKAVEPAAIPSLSVSGAGDCWFPGVKVWRGIVDADAVDVVSYDAGIADDLVRRDAQASQALRADNFAFLDHCSFAVSGSGSAALPSKLRAVGIRVASATTLPNAVSQGDLVEACCAIVLAAESAHAALEAMHSQNIVAGGLSAWSLVCRRTERWSWFFRWPPVLRHLGVSSIPPLPCSGDEVARLYAALRIPMPAWARAGDVDSNTAKKHDWYTLGLALGQAAATLITGRLDQFEILDSSHIASTLRSALSDANTNRLLRPALHLAIRLLENPGEHERAFGEALGEPKTVSVMLSGSDTVSISARKNDAMHIVQRRILRQLRSLVGDSFEPSAVTLSCGEIRRIDAATTLADLEPELAKRLQLGVELPRTGTRENAPERPLAVACSRRPVAGGSDVAGIVGPTTQGKGSPSVIDALATAASGLCVRFPGVNVVLRSHPRPNVEWDAFSRGVLPENAAATLVFRKFTEPPPAMRDSEAKKVTVCGVEEPRVSVPHMQLSVPELDLRNVTCPVVWTVKAATVLESLAFLPLHPRVVAPVLPIHNLGAPALAFRPCSVSEPEPLRMTSKQRQAVFDDLQCAFEHLHRHGIEHMAGSRFWFVEHGSMRGMLFLAPDEFQIRTEGALFEHDQEALNEIERVLTTTR
uniref:Uncharacterized protein n=1 Tax=Neobodo designis TaxID=312471 RepID=A0A7S1L257_NEODS|mmetsp:Transcript_12992/g.40335  ORF Transcript_12992/g.40335 Transcript_12992/m.40335 type:complete len:720 (+) Transcript_12992:35-2194(+)